MQFIGTYIVVNDNFFVVISEKDRWVQDIVFTSELLFFLF